MGNETERQVERRPSVMHTGGRLWFTRDMERRFYFFLTVIVLVIGILYKLGVI